jgi:hypothetical protein
MRNPNGAGELLKIVTEEKLPVEAAAFNGKFQALRRVADVVFGEAP